MLQCNPYLCESQTGRKGGSHVTLVPHTVDFSVLSQKLCTGTAALRSQLGMFAGDDLHPSALQYSRWVDLIFPDSLDLLKPKPIESTLKSLMEIPLSLQISE